MRRVRMVAMGHVDRSGEYADDDHTERAGYASQADNGIKTFRWARSVDEVHAVLRNDRADELGAVPILNSWGRSYPHRVRLPDGAFDRLIREDGEVAILTDH